MMRLSTYVLPVVHDAAVIVRDAAIVNDLGRMPETRLDPLRTNSKRKQFPRNVSLLLVGLFCNTEKELFPNTRTKVTHVHKWVICAAASEAKQSSQPKS